MKYAQIDFETKQMQGRPGALPNRWTTPEGATINHFDKLSQSALFGLGWAPVIYESINPETHERASTPVYNDETRCFVYAAIPVDINRLKQDAKNEIDMAASNASSKYITDGIGQDLRYSEKAKEAIDYILAENPNISDFPILKAEAEAVSEDYEVRAELIVDRAAEWIKKAAEIEGARIGGKHKVDRAETAETVITARDEAITAIEAL